MGDMSHQAFPANRNESLTMMYLSKMDVSGLTPQKLVQTYMQILDEITGAFAEESRARREVNSNFSK